MYSANIANNDKLILELNLSLTFENEQNFVIYCSWIISLNGTGEQMNGQMHRFLYAYPQSMSVW